MTTDDTNALRSVGQRAARPLFRESSLVVRPSSTASNFYFSKLAATVIILAGALILLFARLGHYALWDDEAITAMTARAVWQTGDTSAKVDDHNFLVYRNGLLIRDFKDRYTSPLQFYLIAPFIGLLGESNFVCRLPMALCGLVTVILFVVWLNRLRPPPLLWWAAAIILLSNVSFFLFFRQCRYYGLATMLTALVAYFYCNRGQKRQEREPTTETGRSRVASGIHFSANLASSFDNESSIPASAFSVPLWHTAALAISLAALLAAQYLDYAGVIGCLIVDYAIWGRKKPFTGRHWLIILLPQIIVGSVVLAIWNPLAQQTGNHYHSPSWLTDRMYLLWWNWRDMIGCDFLILPLVAACPLLYFKRRSTWLLRAPMALSIFIGTIALAVPTSLAQAHNAEVRYLAPALVLCIGVAMVAVWGLQSLKPQLKWTMLALSAASIVIEPVPEGISPIFSPTALAYYHELAQPQVESYTPVIDWINANVPAGASIYAQPGYKAYPLMFRAPRAIYAWQLDGETISFTPTNPQAGEQPTLAAVDSLGKSIRISVTNAVGVTPASVSAALIDAWNNTPAAARIAMATGSSTVTLIAVQPGETLHVAASVDHRKTGTLTQTATVPQRSDFQNLPDIHFKGRAAPDYMIRFGSNSESNELPQAIDLLASRGIQYQLVNTIHLNWKDLYRPERIWRSFVTVEPKPGDEIYIYRRINFPNGIQQR